MEAAAKGYKGDVVLVIDTKKRRKSSSEEA